MKVIDIDRDQSSHNEYMGDRYLIVDEQISGNWAYFFEQAHANYFWTMRREIRVEGQNIVVNCPMAELQAQIDMIQKHCAAADQNLAIWEAKQEQQRLEKLKEQEESSAKANAKFDGLKF